jgi:hypothetical protein
MTVSNLVEPEICGLTVYQPEPCIGFVTGYLINIDFDNQCIRLRYPETGVIIECRYLSGVDVSPFVNCVELIQIKGLVIYAPMTDRDVDDLIPVSVEDVTHIQLLDTSDFVITEFQVGDQKLRFKKPLVLTPRLTDDRQYLEIEENEFGISVIDNTREEFLSWILDDLWFIWTHIAMIPDEQLCKEFQRHKKNLLAAVGEV